MGKKGKGKYFQVEDDLPKKKAMITEQQLMDKSHMDKTQFIPMLPEQSIYEPYIFNEINEAAIIKITTDLNYLLYIDFKQFWATVLYNPFLKHCLSSCLTHLHRRWMNKYQYSRQSRQQFQNSEQFRQKYRKIFLDPVCEYSIGLNQVLLLIYHRVVSFNYQNKELATLYKIGEQISKKYILDLPRLLELCEIYGETNPQIVKYIIKMYSSTTPQFYKLLTSTLLPQMMRKVEDTIRYVKNLTDREEYGVNYNYKRMSGFDLSQGEQQLKKKVTTLLEFLSFIQVLHSIINYFPDNCVDHCYYNSQIQFCLENIYLELQVAYKAWNYQTQDVKILGMINYILKFCIDYFVQYFDRCNTIFVLRPKKIPSEQAYINSLERIFKDFGKRSTLSKKNQTRSLLMYKIIQKEVDIHSMVHSIYRNEEEENGFDFNKEYLKEIIITFDNEFKEQYINEEEPRQQEIQEQTQPDLQNNDKEIDEQQIKQQDEKGQQTKAKIAKQQQKENLELLETLVPKRMRSEDYYLKLYADFNKKFYKGQYEDDYDEITDYDKRPVFLDQQSSSQSEEQLEKHLISNAQNLQRINSMNKGRFTANRNDIRLKNTNQPKYTRVQNNNNNNEAFQSNNNTNANKKYVERPSAQQPTKKKYVLKSAQGEQMRRQDDLVNVNSLNPLQYRERDEGAQGNRGGQGFKKSNKSYNHKPKEHNHDNNKGRNTNKTKDYKNK